MLKFNKISFRQKSHHNTLLNRNFVNDQLTVNIKSTIQSLHKFKSDKNDQLAKLINMKSQINECCCQHDAAITQIDNEINEQRNIIAKIQKTYDKCIDDFYNYKIEQTSYINDDSE